MPQAFSSLSSRFALGSLMALVSALSFSGVTTMARFAYDAGATPYAVLLSRNGITFTIFLILVLVLKRRLLISHKGFWSLLRLSIFWYMTAIGYLGSVFFIKVSLAALLFFTFPIIVALLSAVLERRAPRQSELALSSLAFAGLFLALGPSFSELDPRGIALALLGSCGMAGIFLTGEKAVKESDFVVALVYVNGINLLLVAATSLIIGTIAFPEASNLLSTGWIGLGLASTMYFFAMGLQLLAISFAGGNRTAMLFNFEPVMTLAIAAALLGEVLSGVQLVGGGLVCLSLILSSFFPRPTRNLES